MWSITIVFGLALSALGPIGYLTSETKSPTAFIPTIFGVILIICGVLARNDHWRKHVMHIAVLVGLIGFAMPAYRVAMALPNMTGSFLEHKALVMQASMSAICLVFVGLCVNSFIQARKARRIAELPGGQTKV